MLCVKALSPWQAATFRSPASNSLCERPHSGTLPAFLPFSLIISPDSYEIFRRRIELSTPTKSKTLGAALSASAAGSIGAWLTTPIDVIKTRTMLTTTNETLKETVNRIYTEKGLLGFLRGAGLRAAWAGFGSGVYLGEAPCGCYNVQSD